MRTHKKRLSEIEAQHLFGKAKAIPPLRRKRKKLQKPTKIKVKDVYPYSLTAIVKMGINPKCVNHFVKVFPPDYKKGKVRRYSKIPEGFRDMWKVIRSGAYPSLAGAFTDSVNEGFFWGSEEECRKVIATTIRRWWELPKGREIETVAAEFQKQGESQR